MRKPILPVIAGIAAFAMVAAAKERRAATPSKATSTERLDEKFNQEKRDLAWAARTELLLLEQRLSQDALGRHGLTVTDLECRQQSCRITMAIDANVRKEVASANYFAEATKRYTALIRSTGQLAPYSSLVDADVDSAELIIIARFDSHTMTASAYRRWLKAHLEERS
jgi:hypothetical protein